MKTESVGGRMSTSAYSMIYIDASRPDLFKTENNVAQQGRALPGKSIDAVLFSSSVLVGGPSL